MIARPPYDTWANATVVTPRSLLLLLLLLLVVVVGIVAIAIDIIIEVALINSIIAVVIIVVPFPIPGMFDVSMVPPPDAGEGGVPRMRTSRGQADYDITRCYNNWCLQYKLW